ncbi:MAG: Cell wall hydrolase, SleB, partial [Candidatus Berkelbacteria bacterium]|nr:Cell wall hydrolase, SleB [Candidatus Berkelbacteria bacterium]
KDEPSHPSDIYAIQSKDTLFSIAQDNGLTLQELSEANGISDSNKIQSGHLIVIPKDGQVEYLVDPEQVDILQKQVDNGKLPWRLDPVQTAQADGPVIYGLSVSDKYTLQNKDTNGATATVKAESENGNIIITLVQSNIKGDKGIWVIKTVKKI